MGHRQRSLINILSAPPPPQHDGSKPHNCSVLGSTHILCAFVSLYRIAMSMAERPPGAAMRRRHRQLRAFHRHERLTVRMELATALHHSAQPSGPVVGGPREEEVHEKNYALWRQKRPLPGRRPGVLKEPAPPVVVEHAACPCSSGVPPLALPALGGDCSLDNVAVQFFLARALLELEKEEQERKEKELQDLFARRTAEYLRTLSQSSSSSSQRRRKKRRKKTSSHSSRGAGRDSARRRLRQWHVLCWSCWYSLFAMCSLLLLAGPDAWHHGRYGFSTPLRMAVTCSAFA